MGTINQPITLSREEQQASSYVATRRIIEGHEVRRHFIPSLLRFSCKSDPVPVSYLEQPSNVVVVQQAAYGILTAAESKKFGVDRFETGAMSTCVSLIFTDPGKECLLAHVDLARRNSLEQVMPEQRADYPRAMIVFNHRYDRKVRRKVEEFARLNAERVNTLPLENDIAVGVRLDGSIYKIVLSMIRHEDTIFLLNGYVAFGTMPEEEDKRISSPNPNFKRMEIQRR